LPKEISITQGLVSVNFSAEDPARGAQLLARVFSFPWIVALIGMWRCFSELFGTSRSADGRRDRTGVVSRQKELP
jgi:hypothetical protein